MFAAALSPNSALFEGSYWIKLPSDTYGPRCRQFNLRLISHM